jgi:hypothetical protein
MTLVPVLRIGGAKQRSANGSVLRSSIDSALAGAGGVVLMSERAADSRRSTDCVTSPP